MKIRWRNGTRMYVEQQSNTEAFCDPIAWGDGKAVALNFCGRGCPQSFIIRFGMNDMMYCRWVEPRQHVVSLLSHCHIGLTGLIGHIGLIACLDLSSLAIPADAAYALVR